MTDDRCAVCGTEETPHREAEAAGKIRHRFSVDGKLEAVRSEPQRRQGQIPIMVVGAVDVNLRQLLHQKGILTDEDLAALLNPGPRIAGDREPGQTEGSG